MYGRGNNRSNYRNSGGYNRNGYDRNDRGYRGNRSGYGGGQREQRRAESRDPSDYTVAVSQPRVSKYGDGEYVTVSIKAHGDTIFKVYLSVNMYGAFKGLQREALEDLYFALGEALGLSGGVPQQQRQPQQQRRAQPVQSLYDLAVPEEETQNEVAEDNDEIY